MMGLHFVSSLALNNTEDYTQLHAACVNRREIQAQSEKKTSPGGASSRGKHQDGQIAMKSQTPSAREEIGSANWPNPEELLIQSGSEAGTSLKPPNVKWHLLNTLRENVVVVPPHPPPPLPL